MAEDTPALLDGVIDSSHRGLCKASVQNKHNTILIGCPILLQLWSYERIAIGRPIIDHSPYEPDMYGDTEDDRPTMGTLWYARRVRKWLLLILFCWQFCCFVWHSLYFLLVYIINFVQKSWAHVQSRRSYPEFVAEFDRLTPEDIVWEPYSLLVINTRAPFGISSVCSQDQGLWMTTWNEHGTIYAISSDFGDRMTTQHLD